MIAFVVGEFDFVEDTTKEGVKVRVYTPLGKRDQGKFALNVASMAFLVILVLDCHDPYRALL